MDPSTSGYPASSFCHQTMATITEVVKEVLTGLRAGNKNNDEVTLSNLKGRSSKTGISLSIHTAR